MFSSKKLMIALAVIVTAGTYLPQEAQADGPLRRWWRNLTGRNCGCQTQFVPQYTAQYAAANPANLQPGQCMKTCQQTCTRTVVNYVPQTAYRTVYKRVPVTSYRPVTNSDPCTGCTVTCMRPCTTYTYQVQRVPYTTYRPVYRQESYRVPVTTITNDCATGNCGVPMGCSTCSTGVLNPAQSFSPTTSAPATTSQTYYESPTDSGFRTSTPTPADQPPTLEGVPEGISNPQTSQRPSINAPQGTINYKASAPTPVYQQLHQPAVIGAQDKTARVAPRTPVRQAFNYTPVRLASSRKTFQPTQPSGQVWSTSSRVAPQPANRTNRWVEVQ